MPLQAAADAADSSFGANPVGSPVVPCPFANANWIEIMLVDDEGQPVAGEPFVLVKPDGSKVEGALDAKGRFRIDGIDPGNCEVTFPELHEHGWPGRAAQAVGASASGP